jgi:hypothetical protein
VSSTTSVNSKSTSQSKAQEHVLGQAQTLLSNVPDCFLGELYEQWLNGRTKVSIERDEFGIVSSCSKAITAAWDRLGLPSTRRKSCAVCGSHQWVMDDDWSVGS